ncbi:autophagy-related protein 2 [Rhizina undulata]
MFRLPSVYGFSVIPEMWEKKFFRWMLQKFDLLEERTLSDLSNLEGSLGRNSVATLKDVHLKVDTIKRWLKLSHFPNVDLTEAIIGTVSMKVPSSSFWLSGSIEISISDVRVTGSVKPPSKDEYISGNGRKRQSSGVSSDEESDDGNFPSTAQDLAKSFLDDQSKQEKDELMKSLSLDQPESSTTTTEPSVVSSDDDTDDEEEGRGTGMPLGFPDFLARWLQGVGDKVKVKVQGIEVNLSVNLPSGELVEYVLEIEDFDVEGVTSNTLPSTGNLRTRKEGKRCITLANIKGFLISETSLFEPPPLAAASQVFGASSECTERALPTSKETIAPNASNLESSVTTIKEDEPEKVELIQKPQTPPKPVEEDEDEDEDEGVEINVNVSDDSSNTTDSDHFADYEESDEEIVAFPRSSFTAEAKRSISDFDEDSEDEGGATFLPPNDQYQSPLASSQLSEKRRSNKSPELAFNPDVDDIDSSGDDMDQEASRMLSESTLFSHSEAGSLYLSAMSGVARSASGPSRPVFNELENIGEDAVADEEVEERLGKLMGTGTTDWSFQSVPITEQHNTILEPEVKEERRVKKKIHNLDILEIFIPSLSAGEAVTDNKVDGNSTSRSDYTDDNAGPSLPGNFSTHASRKRSPPISPPRQTTSPTPPRKSVVKIMDMKGSTSSLTGSVIYDPPSQKSPAEIEVHVGKIDIVADITSGKILNSILDVIMGISMATSASEKRQKNHETTDEAEDTVGKDVEIFVEGVNLKLLERLSGGFVHQDGGEEKAENLNGDIILEFLLQGTKIRHSALPGNASTTKIEVNKLALRDKSDDIISFIPLPLIPPASGKGSRKQHPAPPAALENDITLVISQNATKKRINLSTLRAKVHFDLQRLEETLRAFGGFGSVLSSTSASTVTITKPKSEWKPPTNSNQWSNERLRQPEIKTVDIKFDARIGGALFELVGSTGSVGLETSPIRIRSQGSRKTEIFIPRIGVYGPKLPWNDFEGQATTRMIMENTRLEFLNKPEQEDLSKLLELLTPSNDRFGTDDDILIDTLLRQREQGSVLRVNVKRLAAELDNLGQMDRFKEIGDEVMKVLTVTDFVTQDERPGILSLIDINSAHCGINVGQGTGRIDTELGGIAVAHVSAPSLVALGIGEVGVKRNGTEELIGEGLERSLFGKTDEGRPMLMIRIVGDEPEPIIKIKLWNFRIEYRVETLMECMEAPENATGEVLAKEMVESIIMAAELRPEPVKSRDAKIPLGFDVVIRDSILGLNPLDVKSRGLLILTDSRVQASLPVDGKLEVDLEVKKASVRIIDDVANLTSPERTHHSRRKEVLSEHLAGFANMGYVQVATISSARVILRVVDSAKPGEKTVDLEVHDDLLLMESCADSTQTLINIMNGLKPPFPEGEEVKYVTEIMPIDMFQSFTEDAFAPSWRRKAGEPTTSTKDESDEDDLVGDDVPMNSEFVESYYGHKTPNFSKQTNDEIANYLLDDDLNNIAPGPSKPLGVGEKGMFTSFTEQIATLEAGELDFNEHHFDNGKRYRREGELKGSGTNATSLSEAAIINWDSSKSRYVRASDDSVQYFPLKIRVRNVHVIWNLHDGYDWQSTRDTITQAVKKVENRALERRNRRPSIEFDEDEEGVIEDVLFNSIYIRIPAKGDPREWTKDMAKNFDDHTSETSYASSGFESRPSTLRGRSSTDPTRKNAKFRRSKSHKMQFELKGVCVDFLLFPPGEEIQSSVDLRVKDLEIFDNLPMSTWKKFVTYMKDAGARETESNMIHIELLTVKPVPKLAASELVLKATVLPLRLHVDQYALEFLIRFFEFKDDSAGPSVPGEPPFLQRVEVNAVRVKLDYKPHKVDYAGLQSGHTTELMNFFILEEADMVMRRVVLYGISGFPRMGQELNDTWMPDIKATQLGDVLAGVAPVRSLVNIGSGVKNLVAVPMREYKKDGRIVRSLQKGAVRFAKHTTSELVRLSAKLAVGTQNILENTEEFLVPGAAHLSSEVFEGSDSEDETPKQISLYADQPTGVIQGLRTAGDSLKRNFGSARDALMAVPIEVKEKGSAHGAAQAVAKAVPIAILRPMIGTSEAVSRTLLGVTNSLDPEQKRRVDDKYKKH